MIPRSVLAKLVALGLSIGAVLGAALLVRPAEGPRIAGGGTPVAAQLGTRFADMAAGRLTPQRAETVTTPREAEPTESQPVQPTLRAEQPAKAPAAPRAAKPRKAPPTPAPTPEAAPTAAPSRAASVPPEVLTPARPTPSAAPKAALSEPPQAAAAKAPPPETVTAEPSPGEAPKLSKRPQLRDPALAPTPRKKAAQPAKPPAPKPKAQGNAPRDNRQGAQVNSGGAAKQSGARKAPATASGNAAAANYPGKVMARIARAGRPRLGARGTAVVSFTIAANGGLAQVGVARSSGSVALDRAALALIAKAAPFPRPPAGAQRRFSITIKGR